MSCICRYMTGQYWAHNGMNSHSPEDDGYGIFYNGEISLIFVHRSITGDEVVMIIMDAPHG